MLISMLKYAKYIEVLRHVSILTDHHQGVVQRTVPQGSPRTPATCIAATTPGLNFRILNSVS